MSEDPGARTASTPAPKVGLKPYVVFEATGEKNEDRSFRGKVQAKDRDDAIDKVSVQNEELKKRFDDGQEVELVAIADLHQKTEPISFAVERKRRRKS